MSQRPFQSLAYPLNAHQVETLNSMLEALFKEFRRGKTPTTQITGIVDVENGGTGRATAVPWAVITGGITTTGVHQSVVPIGTLGQFLTSQGPGTLPIWDTPTPPTYYEWSVLTNGDPVTPELIFADGDVIMIRVP